MTDKRDIEDYLAMQNQKVQDNVIVVSSEDQAIPFLIHLTPEQENKIYIPRIGFRQGGTEDRTIPRVTCSDTLLGCIIGYANFGYDFFSSDKSKEAIELRVKGYRINRLDYKHCLKPNNKLVYDASASNEHWLVTYDKETTAFKPVLSGRVYPASVIGIANPKQGTPDCYYVFFVDIRDKDGIHLTPGIKLLPGYHAVTVLYNDKITFASSKNVSAKAITKAEFDRREVYKPSLETITPSFHDW